MYRPTKNKRSLYKLKLNYKLIKKLYLTNLYRIFINQLSYEIYYLKI